MPLDIQEIQSLLDAASAHDDVLAVSWDAFDLIQQAITRWAEPGSDRFASYMYAIDAACDGRDQLGFSPSMPARSDADFTTATVAADDISRLAARLSVKLDQAATLVDAPTDRVACQQAADAARRIAGLLDST